MSKNLADLRFFIEGQDGRHSCLWRMWVTKKGDIYLSASNMGGTEKVSFHQSGIARYAFTEQYARTCGKDDRLLHRWKEPHVPSARSGRFARLAWFAFPTDYLSSGAKGTMPKSESVPAAESGRATLVEIGLTQDVQQAIEQGTHAIDAAGILLFSQARKEVSVFARWQHADWHNSDLTMPSSHGLPSYRFLKEETEEPQRPIRIHMQNYPRDGEALLVAELGGCQNAA